ncbi:MAG: hypothetical protein HYU64_19960 [Armatimonadetes bacterium]|nr:hypothetical protein [Armatimonadota bacterium]
MSITSGITGIAPRVPLSLPTSPPPLQAQANPVDSAYGVIAPLTSILGAGMMSIVTVMDFKAAREQGDKKALGNGLFNAAQIATFVGAMSTGLMLPGIILFSAIELGKFAYNGFNPDARVRYS